MLTSLIEKIRKFNLLPLFLTNLYLAIVSTFYVYVAATSFIPSPLLALAVSLLIGVANLFIALIVSYNTLAARNFKEAQKADLKRQERNLTLFLAFAIPAFALNFITNLVGPSISLPLVRSALSLPLGSFWFVGVCLFIGVFTAIAFGFYNMVQIYEACQRIKPSLGRKKEVSEEVHCDLILLRC
jgi:hypothetical protein